jgi:hypothetical protein
MAGHRIPIGRQYQLVSVRRSLDLREMFPTPFATFWRPTDGTFQRWFGDAPQDALPGCASRFGVIGLKTADNAGFRKQRPNDKCGTALRRTTLELPTRRAAIRLGIDCTSARRCRC